MTDFIKSELDVDMSTHFGHFNKNGVVRTTIAFFPMYRFEHQKQTQTAPRVQFWLRQTQALINIKYITIIIRLFFMIFDKNFKTTSLQRDHLIENIQRIFVEPRIDATQYFNPKIPGIYSTKVPCFSNPKIPSISTSRIPDIPTVKKPGISPPKIPHDFLPLKYPGFQLYTR